MKQVLPVLALLLVWPPALRAQAFQSHSEFFSHVAQAEDFEPAFERRQTGHVTPVDKDVALAGLNPLWGKVRLARDAIFLNGKRFSWAHAPAAWGRGAAVSIDIETAEVWEGPKRQPRLCVESASGHSGSATRWRHVVVIEKVAKSARPRIQRWTTPYGSCEAVWAQRGQLIAGSFDMRFESERDISAAALVLRRVHDRSEFARYRLSLVEPSNPFSFTATRQQP